MLYFEETIIMTKVRIISLGEIITQNQMKTLVAFATLINPENPKSVMMQLGKILQDADTQKGLDKFKLGLKTEEEFTSDMILKIKEATGAELTRENFDKAWNAMNPNFSEFFPLLSEVFHEHHDDQKMIFISYTNPKDMRHLIKQLDEHKVIYTCDASGNINSIQGVSLYLTYVEKKSKADLILEVIQQQVASDLPRDQNVTFFRKDSAPSLETVDIKYIRGIQRPDDPILRLLAERSIEETESKAGSVGVKTLLWDKGNKQAFSEVVHSTSAGVLPAISL